MVHKFASNLSGFNTSVRGLISGEWRYSYNSSTGVVSFTGSRYNKCIWCNCNCITKLSDVTGVMPNTGSLSEGSNLYFTNERVDDRVNALLQSKELTCHYHMMIQMVS